MPGINQVTILGNVGKDPEIRSMNSGDRVAKLSIATSEKWKDKQSGDMKERTEWHRITVWGGLVDVVEKYVRKGSKLYVQGKLETRKWSKDGVDHYATEIVLRGFGATLELCGERQGDGGSRHERQERPAETQSGMGDDGYPEDSDIPF